MLMTLRILSSAQFAETVPLKPGGEHHKSEG